MAVIMCLCRPLRKRRINWGIHGKEKGAVLLDASSTSQTQEGVTLIHICWGHLFSSARLIHYSAERGQWNWESGRCESSLHESILTIHYWCCIFVIRTSLLHYAYQVHKEYHCYIILQTMKSMRTFWPVFEPGVCTRYRRHFHHELLFLWKCCLYITEEAVFQ